ncbi:MAG: FAD-binding protein [Sandaracinaceae bacterium]|nr:FAD-binding protein [Sandaracinaceae bacterium]
MRRFHNWSRTQASAEVAWESPRSEAEVADVLSRARRQGKRVRPVGSGHSWSAIAVPEAIALDLSNLAAPLEIDAARRTIRVQAGIQLKTLTATLDRVGLAMPILGSVSEQTIAGATSTGTHGSSLAYGNLASLIEELVIVTPAGERHVLRRGQGDFDAACVGLGALGIVTELVLRVSTAFALVGEVQTRPILEIARDLASIGASTDFVKVWWLPGSEGAQIFRYHRTPLPPADVRLERWLDTHVTNRVLFPAALAVSARLPQLTRRINRAVAQSYLERPAVPMRSDLAFNVAMPPIHRETEYAFDLADAPAALTAIAESIERERLAVNFPVEVRFVREDAAWMSPAYGRPTVQIGGYMSDSVDLPRFFQRFEEISQSLAGRPHWGKEMKVDAAYVRQVFPRRDDFVALARRWDPDGTLRNAFLDRVLGQE